MSDVINLMPEEFRNRDEKERIKAAKKPKRFTVELSQPIDEKRVNLNSDNPKNHCG